MKERILRFGLDSSCIAVMTQCPSRQQSGLTVILLNAGLIHRIGPSRVYVSIARALALNGHIVYRVDLDGIGDSLHTDTLGTTTDGAETRAEKDLSDLLDRLSSERKQVRACLVGICFGADVAFAMAQHDQRIVSTVLVNGCLLPSETVAAAEHLVSRRTKLRQYGRKLLRPEAWRRLLSRQVAFFRHSPPLPRRPPPPAPLGARGSKQTLAHSTIVEDAWRRIVARGCRCLVIYSQLSSNLDLFDHLVRRHLPKTRLIKIEVLKEADHALVLWEAHQAFARIASAWINNGGLHPA